MRSDAWTLGIARNDVISGRRPAVAEPVAAAAGQRRPGRNQRSDRQDRRPAPYCGESGSASLTPSGREIDVELAYRILLSEKDELSTGALIQTSPGHVDGQPRRPSLRRCVTSGVSSRAHLVH